MHNNASQQTVCVIGLGYVGLPLAVQCALKGYQVYGLDRHKEKIDLINSGKSHIDEPFLNENLPKVKIKASLRDQVLKKADIILVCVPTPVDEKYYPDLTPVKEATKAVVKNIQKGQLVIIESTINPGVCEEVIKPFFDKAGLKSGQDYFLAHCPERINPGDPKWDVTNIARVVGALDKKGLSMALKFYRSILEAEVYPMKFIREAEAVKIVENSFRDINIAFVNELAKSFTKLDIDVVDVIKGAATKPFSFMPHWPSCGVGGHCIPVDPYYLIERAKLNGFDHKFLRAARAINNSMPFYTVELLQDALNEIKLPLHGTKIGILGLSYKADVADLRESPAFKVIEELEKNKARVFTFDPYLKSMSSTKSLNEILKKSEVLVLVTDHKQFKKELLPEVLKRHKIKIILDGKNCLDKKEIVKSRVKYVGIGR